MEVVNHGNMVFTRRSLSGYARVFWLSPGFRFREPSPLRWESYVVLIKEYLISGAAAVVGVSPEEDI